VKQFIEVIKPKQTALLMITCVIAYVVASKGIVIDLTHFTVSMIATFLAIAGTTALNMWLDRDIDAMMYRTKNRPVPSGKLSPRACMIYGSSLFLLGFGLGFYINVVFATVLLLGLIFDIIIYTVLLKRRCPYSIVLGGFAGAMPALAGWCAVRGYDVWGGLILATIVLLWIPAHIWYIRCTTKMITEKLEYQCIPLLLEWRKRLGP
jgi:protoheme IX farnesyltransferase